MTPAVAPAFRRLPRLPRAGARLAMRLQPLLLDCAPPAAPDSAASHEGAPGLARSVGVAMIEPIAPNDGEDTLHWLRFSVQGREVFLRPDDERCEANGMEAARLIAWMSDAECVIQRLEGRFGASLVLQEPIVALDRRLARVRIHYAHGVLRLAARATDLPEPLAPSVISDAAGEIRADGSLILNALRLTSRDFERLCVGACLLVAASGKRQVDAQLTIAGRAHARGVFDLTARTFDASNTELTAMDETATGTTTEDRRRLNGLSDIPVHIQVRLTGARVRFADLARLRPPALLPLEIEGEELEADIHANGRPYAQGRVVALGDAYGIVIDALYEEGR